MQVGPPTRAVLAAISLLLPFCACHALALLGRADICCGVVATARPIDAPIARTAPPAGSDGALACASRCCREQRALERDTARRPARGHDSTAIAPADDDGPAPVPAPTPHEPRPRPTCSSDTCCVKSAPQIAAWQMPPLVCVAIQDLDPAPHGERAPALAVDWPPTLPLGQPPSPLDRGTLLLV